MPLLVKHQLPQRIYGLALGYEDLNDHEQLRSDPLLAVLSGKRELDEPLAGKSTLNRLELVGRSGSSTGVPTDRSSSVGWHGYYDSYCYLPLYIFAGDQLLCARLRPANQDAAAGSLAEVKRIVAQLRRRWPGVKIVLRADSGFCREELMAWCEKDESKVDYVFGLARNKRLRRIIGREMHQAQVLHQSTGKSARIFTEFRY